MKLIKKQTNNDGSKAFVYPNKDSKKEVVVIVGVSPHVYISESIDKDKRVQVLRQIKKEGLKWKK